ncbi:TonB-dependent receptor domain-containing protein [Roseateles sp. DC23W]|uniref:TonB-dependent receptor domain-containing protein n=1 Tax=Pelomonas dachongensis TaxID=3299029 RepID=A0ABW7EMV7_9BURK
MFKRNARSAAVAALIGTLGATSAFAQEADTQKLERIEITGSRIKKSDATAESPIVTVTAEELRQSGIVTVEQFLNTLPQVTAGLSSQSNNPSSNGRAFIDLRGLGSNRNLVLINGRRAMGSTGGGTVDTNTIPTSLIERVEVITGGAATAYGADAVSGVVNFIMKKNFKGLELDAHHRMTDRSDGKESSASMTLGGTFEGGRGSAVFGASFFKRDSIYKGAREFSAQASTSTTIFPNGSIGVGTNAPSQAAVDGIFGANKCNQNGGAAGFGFNPDGTLFCTGVAGNATREVVNYRGPESHIATRFYPDNFSYNFEPDNALVLPMERWSVYSSMDYEVNKNFRPYASFQFTNYNAQSELAPTPAGGTTGFFVPVTNPFLSAEARTLLAARDNPTATVSFSKRFNALGGRTSYNTHDVGQGIVGASGELLGDWTYDLYASYGRSVQNESQGGNVRLPRVQALINAADGGASLCAGGFNPFGDAPISVECQKYISLEAKNLTTVVQKVIEGTVTGPVVQLPAGSLDAVFGLSYRGLDYDFKPDSGLQPGQVAGFNEQNPVKGELAFKDVFAEAVIPLLRNVPLVKSLSATVGARVSDSKLTGKDSSFKLTMDWAINNTVRVRGGAQSAVRAPNVTELFAPPVNNFPTFTNADPCTNTSSYRTGASAAQVRALCTTQSAVAGAAGYVQPSSQANGITAGNPDLMPEKSKSFTAGLVLQPTRDLSATIDYWSIDLKEKIDAVDAPTIVQRCFNRDGANPNFSPTNEWCQLFSRDPNNGGVIKLVQLSRNQASQKISGIDLGLDYALSLQQLGSLRWNAVATWTEKNKQQTTVLSPVNDFVGSIGSTTGTAIPKWRASLSTTYSWGDLSVQLLNRYIDKMVNAETVTGGSPVTNTGTAATWYHDISARYAITKSITVRAGVSNLADQQPRLYSPNVQANTDPSTFDVLGRRYFVGLNAKF